MHVVDATTGDGNLVPRSIYVGSRVIICLEETGLDFLRCVVVKIKYTLYGNNFAFESIMQGFSFGAFYLLCQ